jgi:hypothetical protein
VDLKLYSLAVNIFLENIKNKMKRKIKTGAGTLKKFVGFKFKHKIKN